MDADKENIADHSVTERRKRHYCCVCSNYRRKIVDEKAITLHRFPSNRTLKTTWLKRIKVISPKFLLHEKNDRLCSAHFQNGVYARGQKENNVPSIFILHDGKTKEFGSSTVSNKKTEVLTTEVSSMETETAYDSPEEGLDCSFTCSSTLSTEHVSVMLHNYFDSESNTPFHPVLNKETETDKRTYTDFCVQTNPTVLVTVGTQTDYVVPPAVKKAACDLHKPEMKSVGVQVTKPDLCIEDIMNSDEKCMFYTGLPNVGMIKTLFDGMEDAEEQTQRSGTASNRGRPRALRLVDEFFLILMRLRLGLLLEDLAQRFHISKSTCSNITNKWILYLSEKLTFLVTWPTRKTIDENMPKKFKRKYPKCRVIIDCTEIKTETPQSLSNKTLMYSHYKSHMTYKALLGITPSGYISFSSELWAGSISDKQITLNSGILKLCESGDSIMADKGFLISDLTTPRGISMIMPPFKIKRFSRREVEETRRIANLRIDVERAMERVKNFRILQGVLPITLARQATNIWKICVCLSNILPPLVHDEDENIFISPDH